MSNPISLLESKILDLINEINLLLTEDEVPKIKRPNGKEVLATSISKDDPQYAAARRLLQGKKMSAGQRRSVRKMGMAALSKTRPRKGPSKMSKSEKSPAQQKYKKSRSHDREQVRKSSDTGYGVYGPDY